MTCPPKRNGISPDSLLFWAFVGRMTAASWRTDSLQVLALMFIYLCTLSITIVTAAVKVYVMGK